MVSPTTKLVAVVLDLYQKSSKGYFPELTELLKESKASEIRLRKKKQDAFREFHCLCQLGPSTQEPV